MVHDANRDGTEQDGMALRPSQSHQGRKQFCFSILLIETTPAKTGGFRGRRGAPLVPNGVLNNNMTGQSLIP